MANNTAPHLDQVLFKQKLILGLGFLAVFFSNQGIGILAIPYYQMTLGVDPFLLSIAMKAPVLIASFFAPWVGYMSDKFQSPLGRRRPFLFVFPWLTGLVFGCIWMVPSDWSTNHQLIYFSVLVLIFYLFSTCWTVPLKCLAYEASTNSHERTKVMGFITYFLKFGSIFYHWVFPIAQLSIFGGIIIGMQFVGWGMALVFFGLITLIPAMFIKERTYEPAKVKPKASLVKSIQVVMENANMKILLGLLLLQMTLGSFSASMDYYVLVYHMSGGDVGLGATWKGVLSTSYAIAGITAVPIVISLSKKYGKTNTMKGIYLLTAVGGVGKWFIYQPGSEWFLLLDALLCTSVWVGMGVIVSAMIADQIDLDEKTHNIRREGIFVSLKNWIIALASTVAVISSGLTLNLIGFEALQGAAQSETAILLMRILLVSGTILSALGGFVLISQYKAPSTTK
ncbi:MFS transporter [Paraglaciecola sp.]|uniref:MFS transporter n=1 Tax=Paraglaciecola sp. TaxID=1920173 RepID=UPI003EF39B10